MKILLATLITLTALICTTNAEATYISQNWTPQTSSSSYTFQMTRAQQWDIAYAFEQRLLLRWEAYRQQLHSSWLESIHNATQPREYRNMDMYTTRTQTSDRDWRRLDCSMINGLNLSVSKPLLGDKETGSTPVPEPGTMLLFGVGLICLGDLRRRYKEMS